MNKWMFRISSIILIIGLLFGCSATDSNGNQTKNNSTNSSEKQEEIVVIVISKDEGEEVITEKEVAIEKGAILMDVMKENFDLEEEGGFITSIDGIAPEEDEKKDWMYFVNDETAMVGAAEYELSAGDKVNFDLQSWE